MFPLEAHCTTSSHIYYVDAMTPICHAALPLNMCGLQAQFKPTPVTSSSQSSSRARLRHHLIIFSVQLLKLGERHPISCSLPLSEKWSGCPPVGRSQTAGSPRSRGSRCPEPPPSEAIPPLQHTGEEEDSAHSAVDFLYPLRDFNSMNKNISDRCSTQLSPNA